MINKAVIPLVVDRVSGIVNGTATIPLGDTKADFLSGLQNYDSINFLLIVSAAGTATGTVNLYVQDTWNNGGNWDDVISSAQLVLGTTTGTQRYWVQGRIAPAVHTTTTSTLATQGSAVSNGALAASSARQGPFGDRIRLRETVAGISGTPVGCTYSLYMILTRSQNN